MTIVVGNPKPASRTRRAAELVHAAITGGEAGQVLELGEVGPSLFGWGDPAVKAAVGEVQASSFVVFASPTFKASHTGLLKSFLDHFSGGEGLRDVVALPLLLGAAPQHALAGELHLKPLLSELGAITTSPSLFLSDSTFEEDGAIAAFADRWAPAIQDAIRGAELRRTA